MPCPPHRSVRPPTYSPEHMFRSPATPRLRHLGTTLVDIADAILVTEDPAETPAAADHGGPHPRPRAPRRDARRGGLRRRPVGPGSLHARESGPHPRPAPLDR